MQNLTHEERERLAFIAGHTTGAQLLGELSDSVAMLEAADDAEAYVREAYGSFVAEDWLADQLADLRTIAKRMRGANRDELEALAQSIEDARDQQAQSSEYGLEQLGKALKALGS